VPAQTVKVEFAGHEAAELLEQPARHRKSSVVRNIDAHPSTAHS
jgi:hypothetical protein